MVAVEWQTDFLHFLRFEKRYSTHTVTAYQNDLQQFFQYAEQQFELTDIPQLKPFHLRSWLASLRDEGMTATTINRKMSSIQSFFKFLLRLQLIEVNPAAQLRALKKPERLPSFLKEKETEKLFEEVSFGEGFKGFTDRLICELLYATGMRRNELKDLKERDVEWSLGQVRILGKGNKERLVPIAPQLMKTIKEYTLAKKNVENADRIFLLILESGKPVYEKYIHRTVTHYLSEAKVLHKKSPHVLRHTFATHLLGNGANIQAIKDLLGHNSLAATQVYTHSDIERLKDIHQANHPRS